VLAYQGKVAAALRDTKQAGVSIPPVQKALLQKVVKGAVDLSNALTALHQQLNKAVNAESKKQGETYRDLVIPAMSKVREVADEMEGIVEDELWPLPKYREMLFQY
jgi:glutamine synthetase